MDKQALRRQLLLERQTIAEADRQRLSVEVSGHLEAWLKSRSPDVICLYHAIRGEPDVLTLVDVIVGPSFGLPVVGEQPGQMAFYAYRPGDPLIRSKLKIMEPDQRWTARLKLTSQSVVVVPCVALDVRGARLGYGGGYYDRFLQGFLGTAIGVVFESMVVPALPVLDHDRHLPFRATEKGIFASEPINS